MTSDQRRFNMHIPVPIPDFMALCQYRERTRCKEELCILAGKAIRNWLAQQAAKERMGKRRASLVGYQWKGLFLPSGTFLRLGLQGEDHHAAVRGNRIIYNGKEVSPSQFANAAGAGGRNAWKDVWLLFPDASAWRRASACRDPVQVPRRGRSKTATDS